MSTRRVEALSRRIAQTEANDDFFVSNAWLTHIENSACIPSIHKLFSLSAIYQVDFAQLLALFGVDTTRMARYRFPETLVSTDLIHSGVSDGSSDVHLPAHFTGSTTTDAADISRMLQMWGDLPGKLAENLNVTRSQYGFIGLRDFTMCPLLRPGSFVQIDPRVVRVESGPWRSELERPIYFVEMHDGYACSWCELKERRLLLVPHPLSPVSIRELHYPEEAEVVGRVTGVATRLVTGEEPFAEETFATPRSTREVA